MRINYILCIIFISIAVSSSAQDVENLWKVAKSNNPDILEAKHSWLASEKALMYKGFWPNPKLKVSYLNLPTGQLDFGRTPMSGKQLMVMQKIPFWKAPLQGQIARYASLVNKAKFELIQLETKEKLTTIYYSIGYDNEENVILKKNLALFQKMALIAQSRYEAGKGLEQDVLRAQVEAKLMENRVLKNKQKSTANHSKLKAILGGKEISFKNKNIILAFMLGHFNKQKIIETALLKNPKIKQLRQKAKVFEKIRFLASSTWIPDLELSGYYTWRDDIQGDPVKGEDFVGASIGISVPLLFPIKEIPMAKESEQQLFAVQQQLENVKNLIQSDIEVTISKLNQLIASEQLYRANIIPQSEAAVDSAMTAYQTGRVEFLSVVNNEAMLIKHQLDYKRIIKEYEIAKAHLATLAGDAIVFEGEKR